MKSALICFWVTCQFAIISQSPGIEVTAWKLNTTGLTGYNGIAADVQRVQYSDSNVYISATGIPSHAIGPWTANPNQASNQNFRFKIKRSPQVQTGTKTTVGLGQVGVWLNGTVFYNPKDAFSYQNQGYWFQNAVYVEAISFDVCYGHPDQRGRYHNHQNPRCVYEDDSTAHSPLLGYAFDGFPVYGPRGYANPDGSGGIKRMESSYRKRNITTRTTLPNGTVLQPNQYGPAVSTQYPLGYYIEDYEYVENLGTLDIHNGRFTVTPEYPGGTYAYFVTIDASGATQYPYIIGPTYYGIVETANLGNGQATILEPVQDYTGATGVSPSDNTAASSQTIVYIYPNPASANITTQIRGSNGGEISIVNVLGEKVISAGFAGANEYRNINLGALPPGIYFLSVKTATEVSVSKLIISR